MKLWFVEPRPNVFVSGIKDAVADNVISYLSSKCPMNSGLIVFKKTTSAPGYHIYWFGSPKRSVSLFSGLQLIKENGSELIDF